MTLKIETKTEIETNKRIQLACYSIEYFGCRPICHAIYIATACIRLLFLMSHNKNQKYLTV